MTDITDLHNKSLLPIVSSIVKPTIDAGGSWSAVLVVLESVVTGVMLTLGELEGWNAAEREAYLRTVVAAVRQRMAKDDAAQ
jgi:hypothetical protein